MTNNTGINDNNFDNTQHPRDLGDGKWIDRTFSAPEIDLNASTARDTETSDKARDYAAGARHADPRIAREATAALLAEVERTVGNLRLKTGLNSDQVQDAIGDTMVDLYARINKGHHIGGGLIQIAANAVCSRYVNGPIRHETAKALKLLKLRIAAEEARVGHHISSRDIANLADDIRMGADFHERHRPVEDFHLIQDFVRPTSFSQFPDSYIDEQMHEFRYGIASTWNNEMGNASDRLAEAVEHRDVPVAEARKRFWDVIAEDQFAPKAAENRIGSEDAAELQVRMSSQVNGVIAACRAHEEGERNENTYALFAPFGVLTPDQRDSIVEVFMERSGHAELLWTSALTAATKTPLVEGAERAAERAEKRAAKAAEVEAAKALRVQAAADKAALKLAVKASAA
jgi:hypothetical protein